MSELTRDVEEFVRYLEQLEMYQADRLAIADKYATLRAKCEGLEQTLQTLREESRTDHALKLVKRVSTVEQQLATARARCDEQMALLDQRDGPPVYSAVLLRAEKAEAQLAAAQAQVDKIYILLNEVSNQRDRLNDLRAELNAKQAELKYWQEAYDKKYTTHD